MKTVKIIILIFLTSLFTTECSKDDNDATETGIGTGTLTIKGAEYELVQGTIYKNMERISSPYNFDIDLVTATINGTLHLVALEMYTATEDDLQPGTYNYGTNETFPAGTFSGIICIDMNIVTEESSYGYITKSGTVLVNKSDSEYELTMDLIADKYEYDSVEEDFVVTESDVEILCYYKGSLKKDVH